MVKINMNRYPVIKRLDINGKVEHVPGFLNTKLERNNTYYIKNINTKKCKHGFSCNLYLYDRTQRFVDDSIVGVGKDETEAMANAINKAEKFGFKVYVL